MTHVTATIWELCDRERDRNGDVPGLVRMMDVCGLYNLNPATVCNVYYQWRKAEQFRREAQLKIDMEGNNGYGTDD